MFQLQDNNSHKIRTKKFFAIFISLKSLAIVAKDKTFKTDDLQIIKTQTQVIQLNTDSCANITQTWNRHRTSATNMRDTAEFKQIAHIFMMNIINGQLDWHIKQLNIKWIVKSSPAVASVEKVNVTGNYFVTHYQMTIDGQL